jgi:hypothetical protein
VTRGSRDGTDVMVLAVALAVELVGTGGLAVARHGFQPTGGIVAVDLAPAVASGSSRRWRCPGCRVVALATLFNEPVGHAQFDGANAVPELAR